MVRSPILLCGETEAKMVEGLAHGQAAEGLAGRRCFGNGRWVSCVPQEPWSLQGQPQALLPGLCPWPHTLDTASLPLSLSLLGNKSRPCLLPPTALLVPVALTRLLHLPLLSASPQTPDPGSGEGRKFLLLLNYFLPLSGASWKQQIPEEEGDGQTARGLGAKYRGSLRVGWGEGRC